MRTKVSRETRKQMLDYERGRQPWRSDQLHIDTSSIGGAAVNVRPLGRGPVGPQGGRVFHQTTLPAHEETTRQLAGLFPLQAGRGLPEVGAYIGRDRYNRSAFHFDPFALYAAGLLANPNMLLVGTIGTGKSTLQKCFVARSNAFGMKFLQPADVKGEYRELALAMGATYVQLGAGLMALSPLYAPPKPSWWEEGRYRNRIEQHRLLLLRSLGETASGRPLTAIEETAIELALAEVTRADGSTSRMRQPTLPEFSHVLLAPTAEMAASVPMDLDMLRSASLDLALRFRSMVHGSLKGVFDGDPVPLDLSKPGLVIDISRLRASAAATALTMTCGQALADLVLTFSNDRWLKILDEAWMQIRYPAMVRRISEGQKLARGDDETTGSATLIALHRISDLMGATPEVRELALGLLADTATRIVYNQAPDQVAATADALGLNDVQAGLLPSMQRGAGLWKIGSEASVVDHIVLEGGMEHSLIQTDSRMLGEGGAQAYNSVDDPNGAMSAETDPTRIGA